jgi:predicted Abi (CAAX) family protease
MLTEDTLTEIARTTARRESTSDPNEFATPDAIDKGAPCPVAFLRLLADCPERPQGERQRIHKISDMLDRAYMARGVDYSDWRSAALESAPDAVAYHDTHGELRDLPF